MTSEEFQTKSDEITRGLNPVLATTLVQQAYERGHSAGYDEVLCILENLVGDFEKVNALLMEIKS